LSINNEKLRKNAICSFQNIIKLSIKTSIISIINIVSKTTFILKTKDFNGFILFLRDSKNIYKVVSAKNIEVKLAKKLGITKNTNSIT